MRLRIGFVSVIRPLFKGDSFGAAQRSLRELETLGKTRDFEVVPASLTVTNRDTALQAARELKDKALDFLFIQHTTFATGDLLAPLLKAARRVGVWALPESAGKPEPTGPLPLNALCGLNMTLSFLDHPEVDKEGPVKWFHGEASSEPFRARLAPTLLALRGLRALEGARILQLGGTAPAFYGIEEWPELASVTVERRDLQELFEGVAAVPAAQARARAANWAAQERLELSLDELERAARIELALLELAGDGNYGALALRCWPELPDVCGSMACAAVARLGDADIPAACEGDVMGALSMLVLQGMSGAPAILMDLSDLSAEDDSLLFWHCGNAPLSWAAQPGTRLTAHFNRDTLGVVRDMTLKAGPATGFRLLSKGKSALIFEGEFVGPSKPGFDGVRGWLQGLRWDGEAVTAEGFLALVLDHRLPHHFAFGTGQLSQGLREFCRLSGVAPLPSKAPEWSVMTP